MNDTRKIARSTLEVGSKTSFQDNYTASSSFMLGFSEEARL